MPFEQTELSCRCTDCGEVLHAADAGEHVCLFAELSDCDLEQIAAGKSPQRRYSRPLRYGLRGGSTSVRTVSAMGTPAVPASSGSSCANGSCGG